MRLLHMLFVFTVLVGSLVEVSVAIGADYYDSVEMNARMHQDKLAERIQNEADLRLYDANIKINNEAMLQKQEARLREDLDRKHLENYIWNAKFTIMSILAVMGIALYVFKRKKKRRLNKLLAIRKEPETVQSSDKLVCKKCQRSDFEYDSYFQEYICKTCGYAIKKKE
jgi:hypothetical protein